jgi:hypothetical protein
MTISTMANKEAVPEGNGKRSTDIKTVDRPRLLSLKQAAAYVGVSYWLLRDYVIDGTLKPVRLPGSRLKKAGRVIANSKDHAIRKIMIDRDDLDNLIRECKR